MPYAERFCERFMERRERRVYPEIDLKRTGLKLRIMMREAGYGVKDIQAYLRLSCPQSIYKWLHGKALPSVLNLAALSRLLGIHMEEMLVCQKQSIFSGVRYVTRNEKLRCLLSYYEVFEEKAKSYDDCRYSRPAKTEGVERELVK